MSTTERLELIAGRNALATAATWIGEACRRQGISERTAGYFSFVLEEILTNLVEHAEEGAAGAIPVLVDISTSPTAATLRISDQGAPFNPLKGADPDLTQDLEHRPIGGLGLYLIRQLGDDMEYDYKDGWNVFRFRKDVHTEDPS